MKKLFYLLLILPAIAFSTKVAGTGNAFSGVSIGSYDLISLNSLPDWQEDSVKADIERAGNLLRQGKSAEASTIYIRLIKNQPHNREAVQGWLMANMKRSPTGEEEAIGTLDSLGRLYPNNTGIIFFKAFLEAEHGHNEEALKGFDKLIKMQPDTAVNYIGKGQVLYEMGKYEEALKAFDKSTTLDPTRFDVWGMKAGALSKMGKFDQAVSAVNKGIELAPDNPVSIYNRACIYCLKGDKANALTDLKKAISMNPSFK